MSISEPEAVLHGSEPSEEEMFYCAVGDQLIKDTLPFINQVLRQQVTLAAALLAGAIAFYDKNAVHRGAMLAVMVLLLLSLITALIGILPYGGTIIRREPGTILNALRSGIALKSGASWLSAILMTLALAIVVIGICANAE